MTREKKSIRELEVIARDIRKLILKTIYEAGCGHTGGSLSEADILTALFFRILCINPDEPEDINRDRFILSKGHATPGYYATLAKRGFIRETVLEGFDQLGSILQAHPDMHKVPGVDMSTGSLGQGLSCALGMALARADLGLSFNTYALLGDGEIAEGQIWEAVLFAGAANKKIRNLIAIVDFNKVQLASRTSEAVDMGNLAEKFKAFGWTVFECDGHKMNDLVSVLENAVVAAETGPVAVIAHTVKGKGVSFMEDRFQWHGRAPDAEEYRMALAELNEEAVQ